MDSTTPEIGRIRPYTIGGPADVAEAWSMHNCSVALLGEPREALMGLAERLGRTAISGDLLSAVISIRCILGFRKDNHNVFNSLSQNWSHF